MDLTDHVERLRDELLAAAAAGGPTMHATAERLTGAMDSAVRLVLLEALAEAADEITRDLAPGSVEVRLRGREPQFVVTPPHPDTPESALRGGVEFGPAVSGDEAATSRLTLRLPDHLKPQVEATAAAEGLSVNAWIVRTVANALSAPDSARPGRNSSGRQMLTGWVR